MLAPSIRLVFLLLPRENPLLRKTVPRKMPRAKPKRPTKAFISPAASLMIILKGQPKKTKAQMAMPEPMRSLKRGEEPERLVHSLLKRETKKLPRMRPIISGLTYCTTPAECNFKPPAVSLIKQAMQKPMFAGLPSFSKTKAATAMTRPAKKRKIISKEILLDFEFFNTY